MIFVLHETIKKATAKMHKTLDWCAAYWLFCVKDRPSTAGERIHTSHERDPHIWCFEYRQHTKNAARGKSMFKDFKVTGTNLFCGLKSSSPL